jgi:hypothetical protein
VLECLGLSLACGRVVDDGDVMVVQPVRLALRLLPVHTSCMVANSYSRVTWRFVPSRASVAMRALCVWAHALVGAGLVMRDGDLSCEVKTGSSSGKLVRHAANRPKTGRLASEGLDEDLHAFPETQHRVEGALLLDVAVSKGTVILKLLASEQETPP